MKTTVYEIVTKKVIEGLKKGIIPWQKQWTVMPSSNYVSGHQYSGINRLLLGMEDYESPFWLTWNQITKSGGSIKKGEKASIIVFFKIIEKEDKKTNEKITIPILRYYNVWNWEQTTGIKEKEIKIHKNNPIEDCENIVKNMQKKPIIKNDNEASYNIDTDIICMPVKNQFTSSEEYYVTLFHELIHSTLHEKRLNRKIKKIEKKEELVAEIGACFLCNLTGIDNKIMDNSQAYINSWIDALNGNSKLILTAANMAQKAVDFILGEKFNNRFQVLEIKSSSIKPKKETTTNDRFKVLEALETV